MEIVLTTIEEERPGPKWQALFRRYWPSYQRWFWSEGDRARPSYVACRRALREHMPELLPTYHQLVDLAGGGDQAARFLSLYCPPPFLTGCSQVVWARQPASLIRNYDYSPSRWEAISWKTAWTGRPIIAMGDCMWGVLDGMNGEGLAASLSFGGRPAVGRGFGVPLVLRYILERCSTTDAAVAVLQRVPLHMSYSVSVLDRQGRFATVYLAPDRPAVVSSLAVVTNHQHDVEWHQHALATRSVERERFLTKAMRENPANVTGIVQMFLNPPIYVTAFEQGFGTLYTSVYHPETGEVEYLWPNLHRRQSFTRFSEGALMIQYPDPAPTG